MSDNLKNNENIKDHYVVRPPFQIH